MVPLTATTSSIRPKNRAGIQSDLRGGWELRAASIMAGFRAAEDCAMLALLAGGGVGGTDGDAGGFLLEVFARRLQKHAEGADAVAPHPQRLGFRADHFDRKPGNAFRRDPIGHC